MRCRMENPSVSPDEIYLASFPFGGSAGMKLRLVLLLTGPVGGVPEVLVAYISSVIPSGLLPSDILLDPRTAEHLFDESANHFRASPAQTGHYSRA